MKTTGSFLVVSPLYVVLCLSLLPKAGENGNITTFCSTSLWVKGACVGVHSPGLKWSSVPPSSSLGSITLSQQPTYSSVLRQRRRIPKKKSYILLAQIRFSGLQRILDTHTVTVILDTGIEGHCSCCQLAGAGNLGTLGDAVVLGLLWSHPVPVRQECKASLASSS